MQNKKGFTLVELLAVVVILGIILTISIPSVSRWIDRSKLESRESMKKTLVMATQSYAQGNTKILPKEIGQTVVIMAQDLKNEKYLKTELLDANNKSCMTSYVKVYKANKNNYIYTPYVTCEGDSDTHSSEVDTTPTISIGFYSSSMVGGNIQNVATSSFKAIITGGTRGEKKIKVDGYSYSISVRYNPGEQPVEIFNSGSLSGGGMTSITLEKSLSDYTDITKVNEFFVRIKAYNNEGKVLEKTRSSLYKDTTPPICGTITGQAGASSWLNTRGSKRTISVLCSDGDGSGCVKEKFTQTFDEQMELGTIVISDNAGNTTDCTVRVHIDWTRPTLTVVAYKQLGGEEVARGSVNHSSPTLTMNTYRYLANGWMNLANYPKGVTYVFTVSDNIATYQGKWSINNNGIYNSNSNSLNVLSEKRIDDYSKKNSFHYVVNEDGLRRMKYVFYDKAQNFVTVNFAADLDRKKPTCTVTKTNRYTVDGVTSNITCDDTGSGCSSKNVLKYTMQTDPKPEYPVNDKADNTGKCSTTITAQLQSRTRSCSTCGTCTDRAFGTHSCNCHYTYSGWEGAGMGIGCDGYSDGRGDCWDNRTWTCSTCNNSGTSCSVCNCSNWGSFGKWKDATSCTAGHSSGHTVDTACRTIYY